MGEGRGQRRPYAEMASRVRDLALGTASCEDAMTAVTDVLWDGLREHDVSWVGFYTAAADGASLDLGPHRDRPACTPIGLNGVCGQAYTARAPMVVEDVRGLGGAYIACDPRDRSEVVVPVYDADGLIWGVLDLDSFKQGSFGDRDVEGLTEVLSAAFGDSAVRRSGG